MEEPLNHEPGEPGTEPRVVPGFSKERERVWLRRMLVVLLVCCAGFALSAVWFSRLSNTFSIQEADSQASSVLRSHFAALDRGDFRAAYNQFSTRYRRQIPFELFEEMIAGHWSMMRGKVTVLPESATASRVVLHVDFEGSGDVSLSAEFTLVRADGRWWIDNEIWAPGPVHRLIRA